MTGDTVDSSPWRTPANKALRELISRWFGVRSPGGVQRKRPELGVRPGLNRNHMRNRLCVGVLALLAALTVAVLGLLTLTTGRPLQVTTGTSPETQDAGTVASMEDVTPGTQPVLTSTPEGYPGPTGEPFVTPAPNLTAVAQSDQERANAWLTHVQSRGEGTWSLVSFTPILSTDDLRQLTLTADEVAAGAEPDLAPTVPT